MPKKQQLQTLTDRRPVDQFFSTLNLDDFHNALACGDEKFLGLANALCDPQQARFSMAMLLKRNGLTIMDCAEAMRSYYHATGMMKAMQAIPKVYADTVEDAQAHYANCPTCEGTGRMEGERSDEVAERMGEPSGGSPPHPQKPCFVCDGKGKIRMPGDAKCRELVYSSMSPRKEVPAVAVQNNYMGMDLAANLNLANKALGRNQIRRADSPPIDDAQDAEIILDTQEENS